jgi:hypothetical protein
VAVSREPPQREQRIVNSAIIVPWFRQGVFERLPSPELEAYQAIRTALARGGFDEGSARAVVDSRRF